MGSLRLSHVRRHGKGINPCNTCAMIMTFLRLLAKASQGEIIKQMIRWLDEHFLDCPDGSPCVRKVLVIRRDSMETSPHLCKGLTGNKWHNMSNKRCCVPPWRNLKANLSVSLCLAQSVRPWASHVLAHAQQSLKKAAQAGRHRENSNPDTASTVGDCVTEFRHRFEDQQKGRKPHCWR